jgi:S1-C subfamily serine protease
MSNAFTWTCPQCGRTVPRRIGACRCGFVQEAAPVPPVIEPNPGFAPDPGPAKAAEATPGRTNTAILAAAVVVAIAVVGAAAIVSWSWLKENQKAAAHQPGPAAQAAPSAAETAPAPADPVPDAATLVAAQPADQGYSIEELVTRSMPAVVKVQSQDGVGSGFFVSRDTLLTNAHVVGDDKAVTIKLMNGIGRSAQVATVNRDVDLAVLKADIVDDDQIYLALGTPSDVHIGGEVIAIGSPLGLQNTVTRGIVSSNQRAIVDRFMNTSVDLIQTDAAINPGNSGGPLIDRRGRVIGVNTLKLGGRVEGIGFAVSIHYARGLLGPEFALKSDADERRQTGLRRYDDSVRILAMRADEVEARWTKIRGQCYARASDEPSVREWFVLWQDEQQRLRDTPSCQSWKRYFPVWAKSTHDALATYNIAAAAAGVPPDRMAAIRRQYKMYWRPWE